MHRSDKRPELDWALKDALTRYSGQSGHVSPRPFSFQSTISSWAGFYITPPVSCWSDADWLSLGMKPTSAESLDLPAVRGLHAE